VVEDNITIDRNHQHTQAKSSHSNSVHMSFAVQINTPTHENGESKHGCSGIVLFDNYFSANQKRHYRKKRREDHYIGNVADPFHSIV
jgi:hypothetical protein